MININFEQKKAVGLKYVLDSFCPVSAYGIEKAKKLTFFSPNQSAELNEELDNIQIVLDTFELYDAEYAELTHIMSCTNNIIKSIAKCGNSVLDDAELFEIKVYLLQLAKIKKVFDKINKNAGFRGISISDMTKALNVVDPEKNRIATFYIPSSLSEKLTKLREAKTKLEQQISVLSRNAAASLLSKHTEIAKREEDEELRLRAELTNELAPYASEMEKNAESIARLDLIIAKAKLALKFDGTRPQIHKDKKISAKKMFNPQIAENLRERGAEFTPISISVGSGVTVITGANMGGKSVTLKTLALNVLLMQMGFFVYAEKLSAPLFDFCALGISETERSDKGLSSFGGEIVRLNEIYQKTKEQFGLIISDEFAKGTNAVEGQEIFSAVVQTFNVKNSITVMTTHYDGVAKYASKHYQVMGLAEIDKNYVPSKNADDNIQYLAKRMNYGLKEVSLGSCAPKEALAVCAALGLDSDIMNKIETPH